MCGLRGEIERDAGVETLLCGLTGDEEALSGSLERPVEGSEEGECAVSQDFSLRLFCDFSMNLYGGDHDCEDV